MKNIQLLIELNDELTIKNVVISYNDTKFESDSKLLKMIAIALVKSYYMNEESLELQDLLSELGIKLTNK